MSKMIHQIIVYLENRLTEELDYEDLYKNMGYSKFHLTREFKTKTGFTISEYYLKRRLSDAAYEILNAKKNMIDIAYKYGFNSDSYFSRSFKKEFKISPKQYRNHEKFIVFTKKIHTKEGIIMKYTNKDDLVNDLLKCSSTEELKGFFSNVENCLLTKQENSQLEIVYIQYSEVGLGKQLSTLHLNLITGHHSVINIYQITDQDGPKIEMQNLFIEGGNIVVHFVDHATNKISKARLEPTKEKKINCNYGWSKVI
jgi:AraC-like DNA-binding protein